jgi:hypothetical protein
LPLTTFQLESKPCLDPNEVSISGKDKFYPLEKDRSAEACTVIKQFNKATDSRYQDLGLSISEYEVQQESKVLTKLKEMPNFS